MTSSSSSSPSEASSAATAKTAADLSTSSLSDEAMLSPSVLHQLSSLQLRARLVADAILSGSHRSRRFGSSAEFAEHKLYAPGDDIRFLDWKVMARKDRLYVRRTEDETRTDVIVVVDTSNSMAYAGGATGRLTNSKLEVARTLAAAVSHVAIRSQDAPGLALFADGERLWMPPRGRADALPQVMAELGRIDATGKTALADALEAVSSRLRRKAVVVVISDLIDCTAESLDALGVLRRRGCDAVVLQVMHEDELDFPYDGVVKFEDLEGDREVQVDAPLVRKAYLEELRRFLDDAEARCASNDARYALVRTDTSVVPPLANVLANRMGGAR